jgi:hypothetical protein
MRYEAQFSVVERYSPEPHCEKFRTVNVETGEGDGANRAIEALFGGLATDPTYRSIMVEVLGATQEEG